MHDPRNKGHGQYHRAGLGTLALGAFGIGVTEFAPMGMLPAMASDLQVSIPTAGLLVSAYALGVMAGGPVMALLTTGMERRRQLMVLTCLFTLGNLLAALSHSYGMLLTARLITSLHHGAFFGTGALVAAELVPPQRRSAAVATMFMGLTLANLAGVPLAAWASEHIGWRMAFWGMTMLGLGTLVALRFALPCLPPLESGHPLAEMRVVLRPAVLRALALTVFGSTALFTVFTYIAPILRHETQGSVNYVTAMLITCGAGFTLGNWLGGRAADRGLARTLFAAFAVLTLILLAFPLVMRLAVPMAVLIFLWAVASFALVPALQVGVMAAAHDAPSLASTMNIGAFNMGNAMRAALGGAVIAAGWGYVMVPLAGAGAAAVAVAFMALSGRLASVFKAGANSH